MSVPKIKPNIVDEISPFVSTMVHELRSPLSIIKSSADLALQEWKVLPEEDVKKLLLQIKNSATDLLEIVGELLDTASLEEGHIQLNTTLVNMNELLQEESDYYGVLAKKNNIVLKLVLDPTTPLILIDKLKIKEVVNNLLSNALKFTPIGGTVVIKSKVTEDSIEICVCDNGQGIGESFKDSLFRKFKHTESKFHKDQKGTGLGLSIARAIIAAHNGQIWYEENIPLGSKFIFTLPLINEYHVKNTPKEMYA